MLGNKGYFVRKQSRSEVLISGILFGTFLRTQYPYVFSLLIHKIRHFACERDFYVFRNNMYKTYFESFNHSQKFRYHANKTFSSDSCLIRMTWSLLREIVWVEMCLIHVISKSRKSLSEANCLILQIHLYHNFRNTEWKNL